MELGASVQLVLAVVGVVELLRRVQVKDYFAAISIAAAALVGALAGYFGVYDVPTVADGIVLGLSASGLITALTKIPGQTINPHEGV